MYTKWMNNYDSANTVNQTTLTKATVVILVTEPCNFNIT